MPPASPGRSSPKRTSGPHRPNSSFVRIARDTTAAHDWRSQADFTRQRVSARIGVWADFCVGRYQSLIFVIRHRPHGRAYRSPKGAVGNRLKTEPRWSNVPARTFADVGGLDVQKRRISSVVQNRFFPERFKQHGVVQNGVLLYGPRGTGKTFLAEATAGEFKINYWYAKPTSLMERWIGSSDANIREAFARAYAHRSVLFSLDEIDSIGAQRQQLSRNDDPGGGSGAYNSIVTELMQCVDQYRGTAGFILMAATNFYEGLDEALVRDMRFDEKIRLDLPDEAARAQIVAAQLSKRLWTPFPVEPFANRTPGWSAAKLTGFVNKAGSIAALENRRMEQRDLQRAFDQGGGRPAADKARRLVRSHSPCRGRTGPAKSDPADGRS
jgi:ATP-dependent Zn protease